MASGSLDGIGVLVTRPKNQARELVAEIERRGGRALPFPVLEIVPTDRASLEASAARLSAADVTIFISRNAVRYGIDFADGDVAAIGQGTARAIEAAGRPVSICPARGFDSEHLLAEPAFDDPSGRVVRIVRGDGGRELLAESLRSRGAVVEYLNAYERRLPAYSADEIAGIARRLQAGDIDAVVVMSVQSLENLLALLPDSCRTALRSTPLVTPSARVIKEALEHIPGCRAVLARAPDAETIADSLTAVRTLCRTNIPETD